MSLNPNSNSKASYELAASMLFGKGLLVPKYIQRCTVCSMVKKKMDAIILFV